MTARRPFSPPDPPAVPDVPRLQVQRATRGVKERGKWFAAFTLCLGGLFGWAWLWGFVLPPDAVALGCVALPGFLAGGAGLVYFGLPLADEVTRWLLFVAAARQEIALRADAVQTGLDAVEAHAARWYRLPRRRERIIKVRVAGQGAGAAPGPPQRPVEATTRHLPELPPAPPPVVYAESACEIVVRTLALGAPCSERRRPGGLTKDAYREAVTTLIAAGVVLAPAKGQGIALAPAFARLAAAPSVLHGEVCRALGALPSPGECAAPNSAP